VDVSFVHAGQSYTFRSETRGRVWWHCPRPAQVETWKLSLPLRVQEQRARRHMRLDLADLPVDAGFTSVLDGGPSFRAHVRNVSAGGLSAVAGRAARAVRPGELYWARFNLPGDPQLFEFVVRIAHVRPNPSELVFGCAYCATDDPLLLDRQLAQLENYLVARAPVAAPAVHAEGA
jgi:c-di-GMP-binding flagellar brake protein YcgR